MKYILLICTSCLLFVACTNPHTATFYAEKFCACSEELSKAEIKKQYKKLTEESEEYQRIVSEHADCMGKDDPWTKLETKEEQTAFTVEYIETLIKKCPNIARNYGYLKE